MDFECLYDAIFELQEALAARHHDPEIGCLDYKVVRALAATYELQDYLSGEISRKESASYLVVGE